MAEMLGAQTDQALSTVVVDERNSLQEAGFGSGAGFDLLQRMAKLLAASELVPEQFRGKIANCTIALEMAKRIGASPLAVMQSMFIVHGRPSWSSQFIIAAVNSTGKFSPIRFRKTGTEGEDDRTCIAWVTEKATGEVLESPPVSISMAKKEGWYSRNGSKWQTMPELMLSYRAATLFGRLYAPEVLMGMKSEEEAIDITPDPAPGGNGTDAPAILAPTSRTEALVQKLVTAQVAPPAPPRKSVV